MEDAIKYLKEKELKLRQAKDVAEKDLKELLTAECPKGFLKPDTRKKYSCERFLEAMQQLEDCIHARLELELVAKKIID